MSFWSAEPGIVHNASSVLVKEPDVSSIGDHVPAHIRSVVRQCLVKDPKERLRDIGDVRLAMKGTFEIVVSTAWSSTDPSQQIVRAMRDGTEEGWVHLNLP